MRAQRRDDGRCKKSNGGSDVTSSSTTTPKLKMSDAGVYVFVRAYCGGG